MTENLAGRGEGLAGLVAKWREIGKKYLGPPLKLKSRDETMVMAGIETAAQAVYVICADQLQAEIAALEAAAPPSTAPPVNADYQWGLSWRDAAVSWQKDVCVALNMPMSPKAEVLDKLRALATPSPQAPQKWGAEIAARAEFGDLSPTSAREQSSATASDNLSVAIWNQALHEAADAGSLAAEAYIENLDDGQVIRADSLAEKVEASILALKKEVPATQEQPAGSGATPQVIADLQIALRLVGDWKEDSRGLVHVHKDAIRKAIVAALRSAGNCGSPRKVGEDGALKKNPLLLLPDNEWGSLSSDSQRKIQKWFEVATEHLEQMLRPTSDASIREALEKLPRYVFAPETDACCRRIPTGSWLMREDVLKVLRPSSVPVGEQKQEKGV